MWWLLLLQSTGSRAGAQSCGAQAPEQRLSSCGMGLVALQRVGSSPGEVSVSAHPHICVLLVLASLDFLFHAI